MRKYFYYVFIFVAVGCTSFRAFYDYDRTVDFTEYKSFLFFADVGKGLKELDKKRFKRAVQNELDSEGIKPTQYPSLYVNIVVERTEIIQNNVAFGMGTGGRNANVGFSTSTQVGSKKYDERVTIDIVDAITNKVVWQGTSNATVRERMKPLDRVEHVEKIVAEIMSNFPPR